MPLPAQCLGYPWIVPPMPHPSPPPPREWPSPDTPSRRRDARLTRDTEPAPPGMLNPFVAAAPEGTPILFDMRKEPRKAKRDEYLQHHRYSLFSEPTRDLRLVCKDFPWEIVIEDEWVVCGTVWERLYHELQERITPFEWAVAGAKGRKKIDRAVRHREAQSGNSNLKPLRIDWLGENTIFSGLERGEDFVKELTLPGEEEPEDEIDTWVVKFSRRQ